MFKIGPISTPGVICETMVLIMTINLEVKTRLIRVRVGDSDRRRIKIFFFLMRPTTSPMLVLSLLLNKI
jgi:hypothetical protein